MTNDSSENNCVVLVPVRDAVDPQCERSLKLLEERGYTVRRVPGSSDMSLVRSCMASDALRDGFDELIWIDSDVRFHPQSVDQLRAHKLDVVCAIYPKKGQRALTCQVLPGTTEIVFGKAGGLLEILYAPAGFLLTRSAVYSGIRSHEALPVCNERFQHPLVPYFLPLIVADGPGSHWMLGEDFAFCERARRSGFKVFADTTLRLEHVGNYGYSWEDAGLERTRFDSFRYTIT
jgi:hypothetical protein